MAPHEVLHIGFVELVGNRAVQTLRHRLSGEEVATLVADGVDQWALAYKEEGKAFVVFAPPWHRSLGKGLPQADRVGGWRSGLRPATWHGNESCFPQSLRDLLCTCAWEDAQWEAGLHQGLCGWHLCNWISGDMDADVLS